jgi:major membrane immunogen (membrane-anchored lipoprotein)
MTAATLAIGLTAAGGLTACDGKIAQCNRLIEVINKEQGPLKSASGSDPAALKKLAETLDNVAKKVSAVEVKDEKLVKFRDDYASMAKDLSKASRDTAGALESNDPKKATEAAKAMSGFGPRESALVDNINKYCSGG